MSQKREIREAIRKIAGYVPSDAIPCKVVSVQDYSCVVKQIENDVEIPDVRLNSAQDPQQGVVIKPSVGSVVLIEAINSVDYYVAMFSKIDSFSLKIGNISIEVNNTEIKLNNAQCGSFLTDINKLVSEINKTRSDIRSLKQSLALFLPTGTPADGAAWTAAFSGYYTQPLTDTTKDQLKDEKVKH